MLGLANGLFARGDIDAAADIYIDAMRLDPADGFNIRYRLAKAFLATGYLVRLRRLVASYGQDHSAAWRWTHALTEFKLDRDSDDANTALEEALDTNCLIGPFLLRRLDVEVPCLVNCLAAELGEAVAYVREFAEHWEARPEAKLWVADRLGLG